MRPKTYMELTSPKSVAGIWRWGRFGSIVGIIGTVLAVAAFVVPNVLRGPPLRNACALLGLTVIIIVVPNFYRMVVHGFYVITSYRDCYDLLGRSVVTISHLRGLIGTEYRSSVEAKAVQVHNRKIFIFGKAVPIEVIGLGDLVALMDVSDGNVSSMGLFCITKISDENFTAEEAGDVDPLWQGFLFKDGGVQFLPPPNTVMMIVQKGT